MEHAAGQERKGVENKSASRPDAPRTPRVRPSQEVANAFAPLEVEATRVVRDKLRGECKGVGFVLFASEEDRGKALDGKAVWRWRKQGGKGKRTLRVSAPGEDAPRKTKQEKDGQIQMFSSLGQDMRSIVPVIQER